MNQGAAYQVFADQVVTEFWKELTCWLKGGSGPVNCTPRLIFTFIFAVNLKDPHDQEVQAEVRGNTESPVHTAKSLLSAPTNRYLNAVCDEQAKMFVGPSKMLIHSIL